MRQKKDQLKKNYTDPTFLKNFRNLFSLRCLFYNSIIRDGYTVPDSIDGSIILSDYGQSIYEELKKGKFKDEGSHILKFSLLMKFYHEELLINVLETDIKAIERLLDTQIQDNSLIHPWIYGRLLYDKYFETFEDQEEELKPEDVKKLLDQTHKGVFQFDNYIIGPLGLLECQVIRFISPKRFVKLWHCSDPSCTKFHDVFLASGNSAIPRLLDEIYYLLRLRTSSEWDQFYFDIVGQSKLFYDINRINQTHHLLANTFGDNEMKALLKDLIDNHKSFRDKLPNTKRFKGSSEDIIKTLDRATCFQILLLEHDESIIKSLEKLIDEQKIIIPPTEIRRPVTRIASGFYKIHHECNQLGVRSVSTTVNICLRQLNNLINKIYTDSGLRQQLEWKLRHYEGETLKEKVEAYTLIEEPRKIIRDTILSGPIQITQTFDYLFGYFKMPSTLEEEEKLVDKILWKLGFDINIFPNHLQKFWQRIKEFKETTKCCVTFNDSEKEKIRSASINFWISLEEILEQTLSFITWTLLSDHFGKTHFKYNFEEARNFMCEKLQGHQVGSSDPLIFDNKGRNTLFPLTEGFTALVQICETLLKEGPEAYKRSEEEMPGFWQKAELISFPFESKIFLFDIKTSNYELLYQNLAEIPKIFSQNNVLSVRNRTQHKRDDFPTQHEILAACDAVEKVISNIETKGIYPSVFLFKSKVIDKFNRVNNDFEDYKGHIISLKPTFEFSGSRLPNARSPQIIIPILKVGNSHELLRFKYEESSSYLKYWQNFPRKKNKLKQEDNVNYNSQFSTDEVLIDKESHN